MAIVNYRNNRERIKVNSLGSLYVNKKLDQNHRPIIYIGGQMEHRLHLLEQSGLTFDIGHNLFDGSWFYDYSIRGNRLEANAKNFADNLISSLKISGLSEVDIITESYGGLIAAYASRSKKIHKVVAIHPPILGTPLASKEMILEALNKLEKDQKRIAKIVMSVVNEHFGFEKDNAIGLVNSAQDDLIDFSKLTVVGSKLDRDNDKNKLACTLYDLIYTITGKESDGVVLFDEEEIKRLGANCITENTPTNHFDAGSKENILRAAQLGFEINDDFASYSTNLLGKEKDNKSLTLNYKNFK